MSALSFTETDPYLRWSEAFSFQSTSEANVPRTGLGGVTWPDSTGVPVPQSYWMVPGQRLGGRELQSPLRMEVFPYGDSFVACAQEKTISMSGDSEFEAVSNLIALLVDFYEDDLDEPEAELGEDIKRQREYLKKLFENVR